MICRTLVWKQNSNLHFDIKRKSGFSNNINYTYTGYQKTNNIFFKRNAIKVDREKRDTPSLTIFFPAVAKMHVSTTAAFILF